MRLRQFWKSFFEASANTRLTPNALVVGEETTADEESFDGEDPTLAANADESLSFDDAPSALDLTIGAAPTLSKSTTDPKGKNVDPYDALQQDLDKVGISTTTKSQQEAVRAAAAATTNPGDSYRYRLGDMSIDSPDVPLPQFETYDDSTTSSARMLINFSESPLPPTSVSSPKSRSKAGMNKVHPKLLEKILARNLAGAAGATSSTPRSEFKKAGGRKSLFPEDIPKDWNGIANLSSTKLDAFQSPIKRRFVPSTNPNATADLLQFDSPAVPLTMQYSSNPHNLTSTPTRPESHARSFVDDVYQFEESPIVEPPSVLKNWATRGYDDLQLDAVSPLGAKAGEVLGEGSRRGFEEEEEEEEPLARTSIFGEGAGTTARIDELLEGNSFARILDDDEQEAQFGIEEEEGTGGFEFQGEEGDEGSFADEGLSAEGFQPIESLHRGRLEMPEDTLFGMPQRAAGAEDDSFEGGKSNGFRLQGLNDMDTLHGGQLLESEPFEASPLANRGRD